jgi:hypothetical protein
LPIATFPLGSGAAASNFRFFRCNVPDPAAVVGAVESDDDDEMVVEDKVEEAAFDLKREQIAFINILPYTEKERWKLHTELFFPPLPFTSLSGKFLGEVHRLGVQTANNIYEEKRTEKRRRRSFSSSLAPTN